MANRFVSEIRSGRIDSLEELKTAFKELAKATHPDLAGADSGAEFVAVRSEYENALRDFERHRFGASRLARDEVGERGAAVASHELWACLALFLKRGFPKLPRHEKERLRYEYARWRFRGALRAIDRAHSTGREAAAAPSTLAGFDAFEAELLAIRKALPEAVGVAVALLRDLVAHAEREHPAMRTALVRDLEALAIEPGLGPASLDFLALLAGELGIGPTLG